jgi:hypothetical protein
MIIRTKYCVGEMVGTRSRALRDHRGEPRETFEARPVTRIDILVEAEIPDGMINYRVEGGSDYGYLEHELYPAECAACGNELAAADVERGARASSGRLVCAECVNEACERALADGLAEGVAANV